MCLHLDRHNMEREVNGLIEALSFFNHDQGYIVTMEQQDILTKNDKTITLISAHDLLLGLYI